MTELHGGGHHATVGLVRGRMLLAGIAAAVMALLGGAGQASATKYFDSFFPNPAPAAGLGGALSSPNDVAVLQSTGQIFVSDRGNNRIQRFSANGTFERAWGVDVVDGVANPGASGDTGTGAAAGFEICVTAAHCKAGLASAGNAGDASRNGAMNSPQGIDLDQTTGAVYVRDRANNRVNQYTVDGEFVRSWGFDVAQPATTPAAFETCAATDICKVGVTGAGIGQFGASSSTNNTGLAVAPPQAPNAGEVFVSDPGPSGAAGEGNRRVLRFTVPANPTGSVTPSQPFSGVGSSTNPSVSTPSHLAVGRDGVVYAASVFGAAGAIMVRFDTASTAQSPDGDFLPEFDSAGPLGSGSISSLEIDSATGHLVVGRSAAVGLMEFDLAGKPETVDASRLVDTHAAGLGVTPAGLGIAGEAGRYLLAVASGGAPSTGVGARIVVLDDTGVDPPPDVELLPPTDVGCQTATLRAEIDPNGPTGFATSYRFQVSTTGVEGDWVDVAADKLVGADGDGGVAVPIADAATGLEANRVYRVRVLTTRSPAAGQRVSAELMFVTDPCPPDVVTRVPQQVTDTSALLIGSVNPNGVATDYWFEWGDDSYGRTVPDPAGSVGSGSRPVAVAQRLRGLEPGSHYHYRVCARSALASAPVCGARQTVVTRSEPPVRRARAYEMVTSPDKTLRRGGTTTTPSEAHRFQGGLPAPSGESLMWSVYAGVADPTAGNEFAWDRSHELRRRTPQGWTGKGLLDLAPLAGVTSGVAEANAFSADLRTQSYTLSASPFSSGAKQAVHVAGSDGGPRGRGWFEFLAPGWLTPGAPFSSYLGWTALIDDQGEHMVTVSGQTSGSAAYRDVIPLDDDVAPMDLSPGQTSGKAIFLADRSSDWRPADLVNECTGAVGAGATLVPRRVGSGGPGDVIGERECGQGSPVSRRGAVLGSASFNSLQRLTSTATTALSDGGSRVFFMSPDPSTTVNVGFQFGGGGDGVSRCVSDDFGTPFTDAATECPPQLYVRQYDADGDPVVRWLSRAEDELFDAPQSIDQIGGGSVFEGASRSGDAVLFRTNAPLLADDPNGGTSAVTGSASPGSWDLYRYDLGGPGGDPGAGDPGDRLTRLSAGPGARGTGDLTDGSATVTNLDVGDGEFRVGQFLLGDGVPHGAKVVAAGEGSLTLSAPATADLAGAELAGTYDPNTNCVAAAANCGGDANGTGAATRFVSDSGDRVYFVTAGRIGEAGDPWNAAPSGGVTAAGGSPTSNTATRNLYLYDAAKPQGQEYSFVARLPYAAPGGAGGGSGAEKCAVSEGEASGGSHWAARSLGRADGFRPMRSCVHGSTSGDAIVFESPARLTVDDVDDAVDVYLYDARAHELVRVSAPPPGAEPYDCLHDGTTVVARCNGDLGIADHGTNVASELVGQAGRRHMNIAEDEDGRFTELFFQSELPLADDDVNGNRMDVYSWSRGQLSLVSPGDSPHSAFYVGNSTDGRDVFFWTEQRIDPREIDPTDGDIYDARVGGGIPLPPEPPAVCGVLADGCQGAGEDEVPASPHPPPSASDDARPGARTALSVAALGRAARRRAARTGAVVVRVRSSSRDMVRAVARARVRVGGGRAVSRRVAVASGRPNARGSARLKLRLSRSAVRQLRSGRPLRMTIAVTQPQARTRSMTVQLAGATR